MTTIDSSLASSLQSVNSSLASFFVAIITVALVIILSKRSLLTSASDSVVFPYFLVPALFIGFAYRELAIGYLNTGRDLRRMESNTRSPIFSDFGEILEGIVTVRAFSAEKRFLNNVFVKIDITTKVGFFYLMPFSSNY
jgi:ABC-type multidrug transport system fused ATPase/permease subunit